MSTAVLPPAVVTRLNDLFTRFYISAATYVFESDPYEVPEDAALLERLRAVKDEDEEHALLVANLLRMHDLVPEPGVFPYWHRDLNYLTVPFMANFVVESIDEDLARIDRTAAETPDELRTVHATLRSIRKERAARVEALRPLAAEALAREAAAYQAATDAIRETREARLAKEKAAEAAARKAAQDARKAAAAKAAAPAAVDVSHLPDPNEEGISAKEKAKRTMMRRRAAKAAAPQDAKSAKAAKEDVTAGMPDPNEEGISAKEKAKRTMMRRRAAKAAAEGAESAKAAKPESAGGGTPDITSMPDPDEPGISPKERAKRTMMRRRAAKAAAEGAESAKDAKPESAGGGTPDITSMPDPDEPGISPKERAKRTMMIKRAQKKQAEEG